MAFEIELKVRLDSFEAVKERLDSEGKYCRSYTKSDDYWFLAETGLRVRRENGCDANGAAYETAVVTYKVKTLSDGIEVNDEREFVVSDPAVFETMLGRLGLRRTVHKEKRGWAWTVAPAILAELSLVAGLGWFLELEILAADNTVQTVEESRKQLLTLLARLEIPETAIEERPYTAMLLDRAAVS